MAEMKKSPGLSALKIAKLTAGLLILVIVVFTLHFINSVATKQSEQSELLSPDRSFYREIETPAKRWLNGHLGVFFRFKYFNAINWMLLPLLIYFGGTIRQRPRWQIALVFSWFVLLVVIGSVGYFNWRYSFSLLPLLLVLLFGLLGEWLDLKSSSLRRVSLSIVGLLIAVNLYYNLDLYKWQSVFTKNLRGSQYPSTVFSVVNSLPGNPLVLACEQPAFFYYSSKRGIDLKVVKNLGFNHLKNELGIDYILTNWRFESGFGSKNHPVKELVDLHSRLVAADNGYILYRLREQPLIRTLNGAGGHVLQPSELTVPDESLLQAMRVQGRRGEFSLDFKQLDDQEVLRVRNIHPDENGRRLLKIGLSLEPVLLPREARRNDWVYFYLSARLTEKMLNRKNYLFIQDYDDSWQLVKSHFWTKSRRGYLVKKQLRPGSKKIILGLVLEPDSEQCEIEISDIRVYLLPREI